MNILPDIFEKDGKIWVDTGHADVGPFATKVEAQQHIDRMQADSEKHAEALWDEWLKTNLSETDYKYLEEVRNGARESN